MEKHKISVYYASKLRGFIRHIVESPPEGIEFNYSSDNFYETNSKTKLLIKKVFGGRVGDILGLILKLNVKNSEYDIVQTYNKFIKSNNKYIIMLENPTAIYHYSLNRSKTLLGKYNINKELNRGYLKSIVCISKACYSTLDYLIPEMPSNIIIEQIYPYIPNNDDIDDRVINKRSNLDYLKCLFISSEFKLKSGCEIINAFEELNNQYKDNKIQLTIVTKKESIPSEYIKKIEQLSNVSLLEFNLSYEQLKKLYTTHMILLHPTRQDSYALVVLEAIKSGMVVLATDLYAIPEMVKDNYNGYLVKPKYRFFDENNLPNPDVWNNRKNTIYSNYVDENIVEFIYDKLIYLYKDRSKLNEMSINSYNIATKGELSEEFIKSKWKRLYEQVLEK